MFDKKIFNIQKTFKLAIKKHLNKNFKEAKTLYSEILKIKPDHANTLNNLGEIFRIEGETKKAQICFEKAIKVNPNSASLYNNLGLVYKNNKDKIKAIDLFNKSIEIDPNFVNPNYNLGLIYKELGDYKNAKIFYEKVIKINSNHADTYNNLAITNEELGETQNARKNYSKAIEINPIVSGASYTINDILFETNSSKIIESSKLVINGFANWLKENKSVKVEIQGHTDDVGADEANMALSMDRAFSVMEFLLQLSINPERLSFKGYGETSPKFSNDSSENRSKNRRTDFLIF